MTTNRGSVLVESAIAIPVILLLIYGLIQLGMIGLEQLTVDGGAFTAAHQQALLGANLNNYEDAPTLAQSTYPHLNSPNVSVPEPTYGQPPTMPDVSSLSDQYNLGNPNARHGGVSMTLPVQTVAFATSNNFANLIMGMSNSISVTGIAIDPAFQLINGHGDVSGNGFNTSGAFSTATDPLVDGTNAPPYFIGFNYLQECPYSNAANYASGWNACPQPIFAGLGLAEYLDVNNWGRPVNGVIPSGQAVFWEAQLHQNRFANIANALAGAWSDTQKKNILDPTLPGDTQCVYSFDNTSLGTYTAGTTTIGDYPLYPAGTPAACGS